MSDLALVLDDLQYEAAEHRELDEKSDSRRDRIAKLINAMTDEPLNGAALLAYIASNEQLWENTPLETP